MSVNNTVMMRSGSQELIRENFTMYHLFSINNTYNSKCVSAGLWKHRISGLCISNCKVNEQTCTWRSWRLREGGSFECSEMEIEVESPHPAGLPPSTEEQSLNPSPWHVPTGAGASATGAGFSMTRLLARKGCKPCSLHLWTASTSCPALLAVFTSSFITFLSPLLSG